MGNDFEFSVLMPIYNVEKYLADAIDSLINQSIGFEENIELVIVDDGSPDNSKDIALKYQEKYPDNIKVFSKSNGGQASAFNFGLKHVQGKYINFLDSDDYLSPNTFEDVHNFLEEHDDEVDVVSIPMMYFEDRTGQHFLNYKFDSTRVIDLVKEPYNPQLSIASSFIRKELLQGFEFDTVLPHGYDALVINEILLNRKKLGVIDSSSYFYRIRTNKSSMINTAYQKEEYYNYLLKNLYVKLIDYCKEKEGSVPKFIQYMMAYNIQWFDKVSDFPDFLTKDEIKEFWEILYDILGNIEEDVINDSHVIKRNYMRYFLMYLKNRKEFHIDIFDDENEIYLKTGDFTINNLHNHGVYMDSVKIENDILRIFGTFTSSCDYNTLRFEAIKTLPNGEKEVFQESNEFFTENSNVKRFLGVDWHFKRYLKFEIPVEEDESSIELKMIYKENDKEMLMKNIIKFRDTSILADMINYFVDDSRIISFKENTFNICHYSFEKAFELKQELLSYIQELLESEKNLKRENRALNRKVNSLDRKNQSLNRRNENLQNKNQKLKENLKKSRDKNKEMMNSTSWKITKPLRMPKQMIEKRKN